MDHGRGPAEARKALNTSSQPFTEVVRSRRMTREFEKRAVEPALLRRLVALASRAPSAGKTQGWHLVVLEGSQTARFWDVTLPVERRSGFRWPGLLDAPVIALPFADPGAYVERYAEPDKAATGLGAGVEAWPTPYWTIDASMAVMTLLLAAEDVGLGALFFGVFRGEPELRSSLGVPDGLQLLGAIALGWPVVPSPDVTSGSVGDGSRRGPGRSAARPRRIPDEIVHLGGW